MVAAADSFTTNYTFTCKSNFFTNHDCGQLNACAYRKFNNRHYVDVTGRGLACDVGWVGVSGKENIFNLVTNGEGYNVFVVSIFNSHNRRPNFVANSECHASKVSRTYAAHPTKLLQPPLNISKFWGRGVGAGNYQQF